MAQKNNKGSNRQGAVTPKESKLYISRRFLAEFYGLIEWKLLFAVSEISYGDADVHITPAIAIIGSDLFIDLKTGEYKKNATAAGFKQDLYPAIVSYDVNEDKFIFKSSIMTTAGISANELRGIYGQSVINKGLI